MEGTGGHDHHTSASTTSTGSNTGTRHQEEVESLIEKAFTNNINSPSFSSYLAPEWNEVTEVEMDESVEVTGEDTWRTARTASIESMEEKEEDMEEVGTEYVIFDDKSQCYISIKELVSSELEAYVNKYITAFMESFKEYYIESTDSAELLGLDFELVTRKLLALISEAIRKDAFRNSQYCKKLIKWLSSKSNASLGEEASTGPLMTHGQGHEGLGQELSNLISSVNELCDEYMKFAPGPWRECCLIEAFKGNLLSSCNFLN